MKFYAKPPIKIQKIIENLIIEILEKKKKEKNLYFFHFFYLKVAVWILPEARVQTVGTR